MIGVSENSNVTEIPTVKSLQRNGKHARIFIPIHFKRTARLLWMRQVRFRLLRDGFVASPLMWEMCQSPKT